MTVPARLNGETMKVTFLHSCFLALVVSSLGLVLSSVAHAETTPEIGGGIALDFNAGGQDMLVLEFTDGSEQNITGGQGVSRVFPVSG